MRMGPVWEVRLAGDDGMHMQRLYIGARDEEAAETLGLIFCSMDHPVVVSVRSVNPKDLRKDDVIFFVNVDGEGEMRLARRWK